MTYLPQTSLIHGYNGAPPTVGSALGSLGQQGLTQKWAAAGPHLNASRELSVDAAAQHLGREFPGRPGEKDVENG